MKTELQDKITRLNNNPQNTVTLQKEILHEAINEVCKYAIYGLKALPNDKKYLSQVISETICNKETVRKLRQILLVNRDICEYENFISKMRMSVEKIYNKYFHSCTIEKNGTYYNPIVQMEYNCKTGLWERKEDGWCYFTAFMTMD